jgi:hypothetical protein
MFKLKENIQSCGNLNFLAYCRYVVLEQKDFDPHINFGKMKCDDLYKECIKDGISKEDLADVGI